MGHREIVVGTANPAKKQMVQSALLPLGMTVKGTDDFGLSLHIEEDGKTAQENARKKSRAYAQALGRPVLSIDNALYLDGLTDDAQPGINTRRVPGQADRATDEELLRFYAEKIKQLGGSTDGYWEFAVCIANAHGQVFEKTIVSRRKFVSKPSPAMMPGYPLESIQIEPGSGRYISEMTQEEQTAFWQEIVGEELCSFVRQTLEHLSTGGGVG